MKKGIKTLTELHTARRSKAEAELKLPNGQVLKLPMYGASLGPDVIDISPLKKADLFTYDPGFVATASCSSAITYIDGEKGELLYRGYLIEDLAARATFLQSCYLLYYGEMPTPSQFKWFHEQITRHTMVNERIINFIQGAVKPKRS